MINPLLKPTNTIPLLLKYSFDIDRLHKFNHEKIEKYRDKAFKRVLKYAYKVPLYHNKYKKAGIHPNQINGIKDISKLPLVSKEDMRKNFPDGLLPTGYNKKNAHIISTGGTTGKSISIYTDFYTMGVSAIPFFREIKAFDINWKKMRLANIGNYNTNRVDQVQIEHFRKPMSKFVNLNEELDIDVNIPTKELIDKLDRFRPDVILSYPAVYTHLAYLKKKGFGKNLNPKVMFAAGSMLDEYTRKYVEDIFDCRLLNSYQSVEAHGIIASECPEGNWHIHTDFFNVEAIDKENNVVPYGEIGHMVMTRLWGRGTPMIRYTGMDDWVKILSIKKCKCGLRTPIIDGGVVGRKKANIVLPDGKVFPPGAFCFIEPVLTKYKSFVIKKYQIIQNKIDNIDILIVIDEDLRDKKVKLKTIKKEILDIYKEKVGKDVNINIKEVDEIKNVKNPRKPAPIVISNVSLKEGYKVFDK